MARGVASIVLLAAVCVASMSRAQPPLAEPVRPLQYVYDSASAVYRLWAGPKRGRLAATISRGEPAPGSAVDLLTMKCTLFHDRKQASCVAEPTDFDWGFVTRAKQCFRTTRRAPTDAEVIAIEHRLTGNDSAMPATSVPRIFDVWLTSSKLVAELESYGCEGVTEHECDRATRPTGRNVWADSTSYIAFGPLGEEWGTFSAYAPLVQQSYWSLIDVKTTNGGMRSAPELEVPPGVDWPSAYLKRLEAIDVAAIEPLRRATIVFDRVSLALQLRDVDRLTTALVALHALIDEDKRSHVYSFPYAMAPIVELGDAVVAGDLTLDDPCAPKP